jgi:hypothetical protein
MKVLMWSFAVVLLAGMVGCAAQTEDAPARARQEAVGAAVQADSWCFGICYNGDPPPPPPCYEPPVEPPPIVLPPSDGDGWAGGEPPDEGTDPEVPFPDEFPPVG